MYTTILQDCKIVNDTKLFINVDPKLALLDIVMEGSEEQKERCRQLVDLGLIIVNEDNQPIFPEYNIPIQFKISQVLVEKIIATWVSNDKWFDSYHIGGFETIHGIATIHEKYTASLQAKFNGDDQVSSKDVIKAKKIELKKRKDQKWAEYQEALSKKRRLISEQSDICRELYDEFMDIKGQFDELKSRN